MIRLLFSITLLVHGLIHLMGFAKAYHYGNMTQLTKDISKPYGLLWLLTAFLFIAVTLLFLFKNDKWWMLGIVAALVSQVLIFTVWNDAKFGTIANVVILIVAFLAFTSWVFENSYRADVRAGLERTNKMESPLLTEIDLAHLPAPVQKYLRYVGVVN